jgi:hypothetical protein
MFLIPDSVEVKQTNWKNKHENDKGRGVFARNDIEAGTIIGDYLGKVVPTDEEDEEKFGTYYLWYTENSSIYADPHKPGIHIINHSCMPNCEMYTYKDRTLYYALRKIFKGEELTVTYGLGIADEGCDPCTHVCFCGTPLCTGSTHNAEDISDDNEADTSPIDTSINYAKPGTELQFLSKYPKKIKELNVDKLFASLKHRPIKYYDVTMPNIPEIRKRIRETGRSLELVKLNMLIVGIQSNMIISKPIKNPPKS